MCLIERTQSVKLRVFDPVVLVGLGVPLYIFILWKRRGDVQAADVSVS